jgi:predicted DNA-binding transcriptional regulator AlpA
LPESSLRGFAHEARAKSRVLIVFPSGLVAVFPNTRRDKLTGDPHQTGGPSLSSPNEQFLSIEQAQAILPMSKPWYAQQRARKTGPRVYRVGTRVLYKRSELITWVEERAVKAAADTSALREAA